jgi:hypothetical protein
VKDLAVDIALAVEGVTQKWAKQRKAEERQASRELRRRQALTYCPRETILSAAYQAMEEAYMRASSGGTLPAHARQIMYAARGEIQERTGERLNDQYFIQKLLPDYMKGNSEQTADWDVVFDARGRFEEPHTGTKVPLGTIDVRNYLARCLLGSVADAESPSGLEVSFAAPRLFPTQGPKHRYGAILFIEKEGFLPLLHGVRLAERYDLAIMSTKGMSVTACRALVDELCSDERGVPLLIVRDFDKSGFSIAATLQRDTRRYAFENTVVVHDLGLRLEDVEAYGLESEEVFYGKSDPTENLRANGASEKEIAFLYDEEASSWRSYRGRRVELNAFTSGDLVAWLEGKLAQRGIEKVIPDEAILEVAYRRVLAVEDVERRMGEIQTKALERARKARIPRGLAGKVRRRLKADPHLSWDEALAFAVRRETRKKSGEAS